MRRERNGTSNPRRVSATRATPSNGSLGRLSRRRATGNPQPVPGNQSGLREHALRTLGAVSRAAGTLGVRRVEGKAGLGPSRAGFAQGLTTGGARIAVAGRSVLCKRMHSPRLAASTAVGRVPIEDAA